MSPAVVQALMVDPPPTIMTGCSSPESVITPLLRASRKQKNGAHGTFSQDSAMRGGMLKLVAVSPPRADLFTAAWQPKGGAASP